MSACSANTIYILNNIHVDDGDDDDNNGDYHNDV